MAHIIGGSASALTQLYKAKLAHHKCKSNKKKKLDALYNYIDSHQNRKPPNDNLLRLLNVHRKQQHDVQYVQKITKAIEKFTQNEQIQQSDVWKALPKLWAEYNESVQSELGAKKNVQTIIESFLTGQKVTNNDNEANNILLQYIEFLNIHYPSPSLHTVADCQHRGNLASHSVWTSRMVEKYVTGCRNHVDCPDYIMNQLVIDLNDDEKKLAIVGGLFHDIGKCHNTLDIFRTHHSIYGYKTINDVVQKMKNDGQLHKRYQNTCYQFLHQWCQSVTGDNNGHLYFSYMAFFAVVSKYHTHLHKIVVNKKNKGHCTTLIKQFVTAFDHDYQKFRLVDVTPNVLHMILLISLACARGTWHVTQNPRSTNVLSHEHDRSRDNNNFKKCPDFNDDCKNLCSGSPWQVYQFNRIGDIIQEIFFQFGERVTFAKGLKVTLLDSRSNMYKAVDNYKDFKNSTYNQPSWMSRTVDTTKIYIEHQSHSSQYIIKFKVKRNRQLHLLRMDSRHNLIYILKLIINYVRTTEDGLFHIRNNVLFFVDAFICRTTTHSQKLKQRYQSYNKAQLVNFILGVMTQIKARKKKPSRYSNHENDKQVVSTFLCKLKHTFDIDGYISPELYSKTHTKQKFHEEVLVCRPNDDISYVGYLELGIGDTFVSLLPAYKHLKCQTKQIESYTITAFNDFKTYKTKLNKIHVNKYNTSSNVVETVAYIKDFCRQIFNNISKQHYPKDPAPGQIPRCNHGGLNHLRSLKFGTLFIKLLFKKCMVTNLQVSVFVNKQFLVMLILSTMFESIMRRDEIPSANVLCSYTQKGFKKLYPDLDYKTLGQGQLSAHQMASAIIHLVLMRRGFGGVVKDENIQTLSRCVSYHWNFNTDTLQIKRLTLQNINDTNRLKFFIYYVIVIAGHYLDHCRGSYSSMINNNDICHLLKLFNVSNNDKIELVKNVITTLKNTEFTDFQGNINDIKDIDMKKHCQNLQKRHIQPHRCTSDSADYLERALYFDTAWDDIGLNTVLTKTLQEIFSK